jgi:hypothetical protein
MAVPPCYIWRMKEKPKPKPDQIEELPDAWERFEKDLRHGDESQAQTSAR